MKNSEKTSPKNQNIENSLNESSTTTNSSCDSGTVITDDSTIMADDLGIINKKDLVVVQQKQNDPLNSYPSCQVANTTNIPMIITNQQYKVYRIRHFLLTIFILLSMTNAFHWIEYAIIETSITSYYQVSTFWVDCTSVLYMIFYLIGIIPSTYLLDNYGLRTYLIMGSACNALGSWIKCASIAHDRFWVAMLGQSLTAIAQWFVLNVPPVLSSLWFPENEITRATAYGVFGNQLGIALGFLVPPLLMPASLREDNKGGKNSTNGIIEDSKNNRSADYEEFIEHGFLYMTWGLAAITTAILLLIIIFFKESPEHPPSKAQALIRDIKDSNQKQTYCQSIKEFFTNVNFILLFISYGLITGVFYALSVVLSQMITSVMGETYVMEAGQMGLTITLSGIVGSVVCGYILGWTGRYKLITLLIYIFSIIGTAAFTFAIHLQSVKWLMATCILMGFFMTGYLPIGFEFAAEVSYPQPEGTSAGLLNASAQIFGIIFTFASSPMIKQYGSLWTNISYMIILFIGILLTIFVKNDLRRQNAQVNSHGSTVKNDNSVQSSTSSIPIYE